MKGSISTDDQRIHNYKARPDELRATPGRRGDREASAGPGLLITGFRDEKIIAALLASLWAG